MPPISAEYKNPNSASLARLVVADLNNDGAPDVLAEGTSNTAQEMDSFLQAALTPSVPNVNFGAQLVGTRSGPKTTTLTNTGKGELIIPAVTLNGLLPQYFSQTNNCPGSLAPGASCTVTAHFRPTTAATASAYLSATNVTGPSVSLSGIGTAVKVSPSSVNFGNQPVGNKSAPQTVTVTNVGKAALSVSGLAIRGSDAHDFAFSSKTCGKSLAAGASCTLSGTFTPAAKGQRKGTLVITDADPASPQRIALSGSGT